MKRILFVCVENSNRSQMAEAFAHIHADNDVEVMSAGSKPSGKVNPKAIEMMAERDYDLNKHESLTVDLYKDKEFDFVISMGCGDDCPFVPAKFREDWEIPDPKVLPDAEFRIIRDYIEIKVKDLLNRL